MDNTLWRRELEPMTGERPYKDKLAIITGGASGLGLALADELAARGAKPILIDIQHADTPHSLEIADTTDAAGLTETVARIKSAHGPIDIAVANAGIDLTGEAHSFTAEDWRAIINTNLVGATNLISAVYPDMVARKSGRLILVSSGAGLIGFPFGAPYTASKAGLIGLGKALHAEAATHGVRVNVVCPPILDTPLLTTGKAKPGIDRPAFIGSLTKKPMSAENAANHILNPRNSRKLLQIFPLQLRLANAASSLFSPLGGLIRKDIIAKFSQHGRK